MDSRLHGKDRARRDAHNFGAGPAISLSWPRLGSFDEPPRKSRRLHSLSLREEKADDFTNKILSHVRTVRIHVRGGQGGSELLGGGWSRARSARTCSIRGRLKSASITGGATAGRLSGGPRRPACGRNARIPEGHASLSEAPPRQPQALCWPGDGVQKARAFGVLRAVTSVAGKSDDTNRVCTMNFLPKNSLP